jgi:hypothetical protein
VGFMALRSGKRIDEKAQGQTSAEQAQALKKRLKEMEKTIEKVLMLGLNILEKEAFEAGEFHEKLKETVENALKDAGLDVSIEYLIDDAPLPLGVYLKTKSLQWEAWYHRDIIEIISNNRVVAEIDIGYVADHLTVDSKEYIRLSEVNEIDIKIYGED